MKAKVQVNKSIYIVMLFILLILPIAISFSDPTSSSDTTLLSVILIVTMLILAGLIIMILYTAKVEFTDTELEIGDKLYTKKVSLTDIRQLELFEQQLPVGYQLGAKVGGVNIHAYQSGNFRIKKDFSRKVFACKGRAPYAFAELLNGESMLFSIPDMVFGQALQAKLSQSKAHNEIIPE
ncbi:hypothetical protein [Zophobihabitans entericus]|uniref:Bacterial Pleckstrin homology domain-containing protein n=1 Tax=Zophobihabitans entericus TaxID=1635327 RepID=A0A6G9ICP1_9GAMM|nr:hypothetical protein [Zophobihabitans entericus]QIQ21350.1 hypothetical protein IPMB12_06390 [Zophobihabitans entericus]